MKQKVGPHTLLLDLENVAHLNSEALGKILRLNKRIQAAGGRLSLCNVHGILEVFEVPGLQKILSIQQTDPDLDLAGPVYRLKPTASQLDAAGVVELENLYEVWWNGTTS
jgi:hypothetical protein